MAETKYAQMKDSGVEWIGNIPEEWAVKKTKYIFEIFGSGSTPDSANADYYNGEINWIQSGDLYKTRFVDKTNKTISVNGRRSSSALKLYRSPFLALAMYGASVGNLAISNIDATVNQAVAVMDSQVNNIRFYYYVFESSKKELIAAAQGGTQPNISQILLKNWILPAPSVREQNIIAEFLDSETNKLDKIIDSAKRSLDLLRETRKSIIFEVVTKGLDNNVEMKDSGVEWIGWIPDSWKISKFKYEVSTPITDGPHETPELCEEGIPFASAEAVKNGIVDLRYIRGYISEKDHKQFSKKIRPQLNDIFIVKSGAGTGRSGIVTTNEVFDIWSPLALIRTKSNNHNQRYFYYFTLSDAYTKQVESGWSYGTQQNIGMNVLENLYVPVPSKDIQNEIVKYLDYKIGKIDTSIRKTQEIIDLTERTKQSLIYEYVTGKKRVQT